ncbi:hypothetical protein BH11ARM2_BH11ARM2_16510 [soil metagenome]
MTLILIATGGSIHRDKTIDRSHSDFNRSNLHRFRLQP